ncbi:hypothetical protein ACLB2K_071195 [Fragaria x ananassa]
MALETLLLRVNSAISHSFDAVRHTSSTTAKPSRKSTNVGVLAFEIAGLMSKLLHLWQSLSDKNMIRLHNESINLEGVRKIVSNDDAFLLGLACAELVENIRFLAKSVARISHKCNDANLRSFERLFNDFANSGRDPYNYVIGSKEMEAKNNKKLDRYVNLTAQLYREMDELNSLESSLRKALRSEEYDASLSKEQKVLDLQQKIVWQRQEIKYLKDRSLWNRSFETVTWILARSIFTILARTKVVFASATVHPSDQGTACPFVSNPLVRSTKPLGDFDQESSTVDKDDYSSGNGFFESNSKLLKPPPSTLGAAALALHYANLIIVMEKMIKFPQMVGVDARDDLYTMLPSSIRSALRARLRGVGFSASDPVLAGEWREALGRILGWLSPLAHNMIKWQSERSFEQQNMVPKTNVMLLQTLFFANKDKTEAAITELLVGLNYICRFEREMTAKALFECNNSINGLINLQSSSDN